MKKITLILSCVLVAVLMAVTASAAVSFTYDLAETDFDNVYKVVLTITEDEGDIRGFKNILSFDNTILVPADYYDGSTPDVSANPDYPVVLGKYTTGSGRDQVTSTLSYLAKPIWTLDGVNSKVEFNIQNPGFISNKYTPAGFVAYELYFSFAAGKSRDDLVEGSFKVDYINYSNGNDNYYGETTEGRVNNIVVTNNVIPEPITAITVPVVAGDVVYLQDGSFATAATTGDYNVLLTAGYVAVNTGKEGQKTYYVDGRTATLVHENGVVATDNLSLRDRTPAADGNDKNGLRFIVNHNPAARNVAEHAATEMGFIMTAETEKVIAVCGEDYVLDMSMVATNVGTEEKPVYAAKKGVAYSEADEVDIVYNKASDNLWQIAGVFYGIPVTEAGVKTTIASRPYYKVGETYVYGETVKSTLYDVATALSEDESYELASQSMKDYIQEVLDAGKGTEVELPNDLMIDLDGLFD